MRSTLAFVIAALASTLVGGAPFPAPGTYNSEIFTESDAVLPPGEMSSHRVHPFIGTKEVREPRPDHSPSLYQPTKIGPRQTEDVDALAADDEASEVADDAASGAIADGGQLVRRLSDLDTLGGNAYTGNSSSVDGGSIFNMANEGMPTFMNINSNNGGGGGKSESGCAVGGHGDSRGVGGNAHSGYSASAIGGSVYNSGGVMNVDSNNAGNAGESVVGCAYGGNVTDTSIPITGSS